MLSIILDVHAHFDMQSRYVDMHDIHAQTVVHKYIHTDNYIVHEDTLPAQAISDTTSCTTFKSVDCK